MYLATKSRQFTQILKIKETNGRFDHLALKKTMHFVFQGGGGRHLFDNGLNCVFHDMAPFLIDSYR
jgi:hypothetical protein